MRAKTMIKFLAKAIANHQPVMLVGAPGVGKSDLVEYLRKMLDAAIVFIHAVCSDPTDPKGLGFADESGEFARFLPYGDMLQLINADKLTIAFLDDFGQAPGAVQAAFMQAVLARRVNDHKISDHVVWVAATNRRGDKSGVSGILEAVKGRFTIVELDAHIDDWVDWATKSGKDARVRQFLRYKPGLLHAFVPTSEISNSPNPRNWATVCDLLALGLDDDERAEVIKGRIGEAAATELCGFLEVYEQLPPPSTIIKDPEGAVVPSELPVLFALGGALAKAVENDPTVFAPVLKYSYRLPPEFAVMLVMDCVHHNGTLVKSAEFVAWATKYHVVIV